MKACDKSHYASNRLICEKSSDPNTDDKSIPSVFQIKLDSENKFEVVAVLHVYYSVQRNFIVYCAIWNVKSKDLSPAFN